MKKITKRISIIVAIALAILICAYIIISVISSEQWSKGLYLFENDIQIYTDDANVEFNINAIVVGDDIVEIVKSGNIRCYLKNSENTTNAKISALYINQNNNYYDVVFAISCNLSGGYYLFDNLIISDSNEENSWNAPGNIEVTVESKGTKTQIETSLISMRSNEICEFIYSISNPTADDIVISTMDGNIQNSNLLLINNEEIDNDSIDFMSAQKFSFPITLLANKKAHFYYSIPINEQLSNIYLYVSPSIAYKASDSDEIHKLYFELNSDFPFILKTTNAVLKYINEGELKK